MNEWLSVVFLSLIQGLTEFLPISSSAHLILFPLLTHSTDQGLAFDVAIHVGTLVAVMYYFKKEIKWMWGGFWRTLNFRNPKATPYYGKLAWLLIFASLPLGIAGLIFHQAANNLIRSPIIIGYATLFFGVVLFVADVLCRKTKALKDLTFKNALIIGLLQTLALIPGTSRSGITLTGGIFLGLSKKDAASFSFLMAIPAIIMAGGYEGFQCLTKTQAFAWPYFLIGFLISAISAFACIHVFIKLLNAIGLFPFVLYRILLGVGLLVFFS